VDTARDVLRRNPITGIVGCCASAASGHTAAPLTNVINSRRLTLAPFGGIVTAQTATLEGLGNVRFVQSALRQKSDYSITSPARLNNDDGTVRPSAVAVVRFPRAAV
jgi:hypothetical protein